MRKEKPAKSADEVDVKTNMSTSPTREGSANAGSSNGNLDEKPRLSEHEKKANHIASGELCRFSIADKEGSLLPKS